MSTITTTLYQYFWPKPLKVQATPLAYIAEAFRHYIHNDIPARLIDTTRLKFVERSAVYDVFAYEIAQITEADVQRRMRTLSVDTHPEAGVYINPRKAAIRETIRDVVRYAIFSHRWSNNEPSYRDVVASSPSLGRRNSRMTGFAKLVRLCETARGLGYKLVWSDTCCIDQCNPAELNEAIHAMFKWYANAHLCIVHLAASASLADFGHEEWFRRGWTLQELLAPKRTKFYDREWRPFTGLTNDKDDAALMSALSRVTGIPKEAIVADNTRGIKGHSISEIMSWAAPRKTKRVEDAAYSLFGIFNVALPIAYGEGERAFPRLVEALVARCPAWDVFAWAGEASERHPTLPSAPACYQRWDKTMLDDDAGMSEFQLTPHGLRLKSVPLIPMALVSEVCDGEAYVVTLRPRAGVRGAYGDVGVVCGPGRLQHLRDAGDLHACILNYRPSLRNTHGRLHVGRTYVCLLLYMGSRNAGGWLKVATDNVLRVTCRGMPTKRTSGSHMEDGTFDLPLETTRIRAPRASSLWT